MKRTIPLLALLAMPAFSHADAPAAPAPGTDAPVAEKTAVPAPAAEAPAVPAPGPGRVLLPKPSRLDSLPPDEREHIRRMAEFRAARDAAEQKIIDIGKRADARKEAILGENEEAKKLSDRIAELREEWTAATNSLETIFREDEELKKLADEIEPARKTVEENQVSLNREVVSAMQLRMAAQRAAYEKANPPPAKPEESPEAFGMTPEAFSNLFTRPKSPVAPLTPNPDIKPPMEPRRPVQPAK